MHIETLKVFCDLVDMQSFSLAAERNFITQSAVSQQIRMLEDKFKRRLLERVRGRREVKLTVAGEVFYRECKNVLASFDVLNESMSGLVGENSHRHVSRIVADKHFVNFQDSSEFSG